MNLSIDEQKALLRKERSVLRGRILRLENRLEEELYIHSTVRYLWVNQLYIMKQYDALLTRRIEEEFSPYVKVTTRWEE